MELNNAWIFTWEYHTLESISRFPIKILYHSVYYTEWGGCTGGGGGGKHLCLVPCATLHHWYNKYVVDISFRCWAGFSVHYPSLCSNSRFLSIHLEWQISVKFCRWLRLINIWWHLLYLSKATCSIYIKDFVSISVIWDHMREKLKLLFSGFIWHQRKCIQRVLTKVPIKC